MLQKANLNIELTDNELSQINESQFNEEEIVINHMRKHSEEKQRIAM